MQGAGIGATAGAEWFMMKQKQKRSYEPAWVLDSF